MSKPGAGRMVSSRYLKLMAGGVSLATLTLLALLAVGFFSDDTRTESSRDDGMTGSTPASATSGEPDVSSSGGSALHDAIDNQDAEMVSILVEGGVNVNAKDIFGESALHAAIAREDLEIMNILVDAGANVDIKNAFGDPVLHRAIHWGDKEAVRTLVEGGADVDITNAFGDSALSRAVKQGDKHILEILTQASDG